jgi:hypothetical protein
MAVRKTKPAGRNLRKKIHMGSTRRQAIEPARLRCRRRDHRGLPFDENGKDATSPFQESRSSRPKRLVRLIWAGSASNAIEFAVRRLSLSRLRSHQASEMPANGSLI